MKSINWLVNAKSTCNQLGGWIDRGTDQLSATAKKVTWWICAAIPSRGQRRRCVARWPRPRLATTFTAKIPPSTACETRAAEIFGKEAALFVPTGMHGQPDCDQGLDASRRRSDLRRAQPRQFVRAGFDVGDRGLHAAHRARRRWDPQLEADRSRHPAENLLRLAERVGVPGKHQQHGRRHGLSHGAGERNLRRRARRWG